MGEDRIPAEWVTSHKTAFTLFGVPSEELNRDELLAAVGYANKQLELERRNHRACMDIAALVRCDRTTAPPTGGEVE